MASIRIAICTPVEMCSATQGWFRVAGVCLHTLIWRGLDPKVLAAVRTLEKRGMEFLYIVQIHEESSLLATRLIQCYDFAA